MSNYYEYEDVKIAMYHALQKKEGWKLYGYKADESDLMTDYYSPAHWCGIGVKNGYILCVNVYGEEKERIIKRYTETKTNNEEINQKIKKLSQMTVERGASEAEAETALKMIETLKTKIVENIENYEVAEIIPAHQANPSRCNWHIEKDGVIIEKGSGLLKFSKLENYFIYPQYKEELEKIEKYENQKDEWISLEIERLENSYYSSDLGEIAEYNWGKMLNILKLYRQFQNLINKIDCACGSTIGEGYTYEKKIVTEYKKENKVFIDETGEKKQGQCFVLNTNFNYGCSKGLVYQIQELKHDDGTVSYCAYKMNGKLTKICTGSATRSNYWYIGSGEHDNLSRHIKNGNISWCHIEEVRTPYEVEKLVKVDTKNKKAPEQPQTEEKETLGNYTIEKSKHTKTGETIYIVKPIEKLSKEKYMQEKNKMVENGGYYSKFVHGFIFKNHPLFLTAAKEEKQEQKEEVEKLEKIEEVEEVEEFKHVFYTINEKTAKMANDVNSFSDYRSGSATETYTKEITEFFEKVDNLTKGKEEKRTKLYNKCCRFSKKLADYYNAFYSNEASCPSVLISGGSNFSVGKKNKQNNKRETLVNDWKYLQEYKNKIIASAKNDAIMSSDANAIQKLEEKIKNLKELQEKMKLANKFLRKKDVEAGDKGLLEMGYTQSQVQELRKTDFCGRIGFSSYTLTNNNANIKRLEKRLENLKKTIENSSANNEEENDDFKIVRNTDLMRLQLFFTEIPCEKTREHLKNNGFRWSPKNKAWQRMLNYNAERALEDFKKNYTKA